MAHPIHVLPVRERAAVINRVLRQRLETVLPAAMAASGIDMWLILCYEDNLDPVFTTLIPMDTWCPILQVIVFYDRGPGPDGVHQVERINISGTNTHDLYDRPYRGQLEVEQWPILLRTIEERDPQRIGINIGPVQWAASGLTHNLYNQLTSRLPVKYAERLVSAEPLATAWLSTLSEDEVTLYEHVAAVAHAIIARCYGRTTLVPGVTTAEDLEWAYWQTAADLGLDLAFKPYFTLRRSNAATERYGPEDKIIRPGDLVHCDVGVKYLRLNSDHQEWAYILGPGESAPPAGLAALLAEGNRLQDIFMAEFVHGLTGDQLLAKILARARPEGIPNPRIYSHSLGLYLHEPGPLIGLPWEQERNPGRGDVALGYNNAFTMELSVSGPIPEWDGQEVRLSMEQDVVFTRTGCRLINGRQTAFHLI
jgi:hypothetical protein